MAIQGTPAFNQDSHAELLRLAPHLSDVELAAKFSVSVPTVLKWKRLPLGYVPSRPGRKKKPATTDMARA